MPRMMLAPDLTLYVALRKVIAAYPKRSAAVFEGQTLTYRPSLSPRKRYPQTTCAP